MKFTLNVVALPLLSVLLATMALTAPMRGDETIRDALPVISGRAAAPAAMVKRRFGFTRDELSDDKLREQIHESLCADKNIQEACDDEVRDAINIKELSG